MNLEIGNVPCPRCGCWIVKEFLCGCGEVHFDHCENCGRGTHLPPDNHTELGFMSNPPPPLRPMALHCEQGRALHRHHPTLEHYRMEPADRPSREEFLRGVLVEEPGGE